MLFTKSETEIKQLGSMNSEDQEESRLEKAHKV